MVSGGEFRALAPRYAARPTEELLHGGHKEFMNISIILRKWRYGAGRPPSWFAARRCRLRRFRAGQPSGPLSRGPHAADIERRAIRRRNYSLRTSDAGLLEFKTVRSFVSARPESSRRYSGFKLSAGDSNVGIRLFNYQSNIHLRHELAGQSDIVQLSVVSSDRSELPGINVTRGLASVSNPGKRNLVRSLRRGQGER